MKELTERQKSILEELLQEYIKKAVPVSSKVLSQKPKIGLKPASLRLELKKLTKMGYLHQPHVSAGRVPTDKAYRFFVDGILAQKEKEDFFKKEFENLAKDIENSLKFFANLAKILAQISSNLALTYLSKEKLCFKEGLEKVILNPEFEDFNFTKNFLEFLEKTELKIENFFLKNEVGIEVLIGKETKIPAGENCGMIVGLPKKKKGVLLLLGPKRMDYFKNINLMRSLLNFLSENC